MNFYPSTMTLSIFFTRISTVRQSVRQYTYKKNNVFTMQVYYNLHYFGELKSTLNHTSSDEEYAVMEKSKERRTW